MLALLTGAACTDDHRGPYYMRRLISIFLALMLVLSVAATADAVTVKRTWSAKLGTNAINGTAVLQAYKEGTGKLALALKGLRANSTYTLEIRSGSCTTLGTVRATLFAVPVSATGTVDTFRNVPGTKMNAIWKASRAGAIVVRIGTGTLAKCGTLAFAVATRVVISKLSIDLAIIRGPSGYPPCNVAMYMAELAQPREPGVTLIYAHARTSTFLPLLTRSKVNNGASLVGMQVKVYTSDRRVSTYKIVEVRRHVRSISSAFSATGESLWLYTSEGPNSTYPKLVLVAKRISTTTATDAASHPRARPLRC